MAVVYFIVLQASQKVALMLACEIIISDADRVCLLREISRACLQLAPGVNADLGIDVHRNRGTISMIWVGFMYLFNNYGPCIVLRLLFRVCLVGA